MAYPLTSGGARHFVTRRLGMTTVQLSAAAEDSNVIDVTCTLSDIDGNTIESADLWEAYVVGEPAGDYTVAETGDGAEVSVTGHNGLAFTFSASGVATISVTDVSGGSNEDVVLALRPLNSMGVPAAETLTFD